ncbi:MAG TPA: biotin/lipoyl-containing protein [Vicinamibacterales bacterium]|nr:biotin/lipoyl-containing protein [Vicinamibacterales bacterium]
MATISLRHGNRDFIVTVDGPNITVDGVPVEAPAHAWAVASGDARWVYLDGEVFEFERQRPGRRQATAHQGSLSAPMPATVIRVVATPGAAVKRGDTLLVLEAMKMELPVRAPADGTVKAVHCREGQLVQPGVPLVELDS